MANTPYSEITDVELFIAMREWGDHVDSATGWSSAYMAATECRAIEVEAHKRGLEIVNNWKIQVV